MHFGFPAAGRPIVRVEKMKASRTYVEGSAKILAMELFDAFKVCALSPPPLPLSWERGGSSRWSWTASIFLPLWMAARRKFSPPPPPNATFASCPPARPPALFHFSAFTTFPSRARTRMWPYVIGGLDKLFNGGLF